MDVTSMPVPKTYCVQLTLSQDEADALKGSQATIPDNLVEVKDLIDKIYTAVEAQ